ncbi:NINE protein [Rhodococcus sp. ABRD24]|uniref:NINE protein n=1 Tax=Rhodococcus sp. ABRD24 TaxID=2507582 RepID=UPI001F62366D|nr:NINE protein [Rhodococcus sp. ABRD24]
MIDLSKSGNDDEDRGDATTENATPVTPAPPEFGSPFDYDATADASLSESTSGQSAVPPSGPSSTGPGWDTFSGVGNGPGWGSGPTYPPPTMGPVPGYPAAPSYPPGYGAGAYGMYPDPSAPFGRDPITGEPMSDKSKSTAGLLQILLGFVSLPGIGRLYVGSVGIGLTQLLVFWLGIITIFIGVGVIIFPLIWIWAFVDGIMMLTGSVRDAQGRPLRS